jgi:hypothetical protein
MPSRIAAREPAIRHVIATNWLELFRSGAKKLREHEAPLGDARIQSSTDDAAVATVLLRSHMNESRKEATMNRVWSHAIVAAALA